MKEIINKYNIEVKKINKINNIIVIEDYNGEKYLIKKKDLNNNELISYLKEINYPYYISYINNDGDLYEIYPYYENSLEDLSYKGKKLVEAIVVLQKRSIEYKDYSLDFIKNYYDNKVKELDELFNYYSSLQDKIENNILDPSTYLLLINISNIYQNINIARGELEKWYLDNEKRIRVSYLIGDCSFNNFVVGEKEYFINFNDNNKEIFLYDFINFFRNAIYYINVIPLFDYYKSELNINFYELSFFYFNILMPNKIEFVNDSYINTIKVHKELDYIIKSRDFYLEENKKYQEAN